MRVGRIVAASAGLALFGLGLPAAASHSAGATERRAPMQPASPPQIGQPQQGHSTNAAQNSLNWAGYAVTGGSFSNVVGDWRQPGAACGSTSTQGAFWVGIDGFTPSDPTVEQIGTDSDCSKGRGRRGGGPSYYAWYELFPRAAVVLPASRYPVAPGDLIRAGVSVSGSTYALLIADGSKWIFATSQSVAAQHSSAEWIAEAPSLCGRSRCKSVPLTDFGSMAFTNSSADGKAISAPGFTDYRITMVTKGSKHVRAQSSGLGFGGTVFSVSWLHS